MGPGRRESILFMGGQKTLTLSIILQVSLFPQYGLALAVCVLHHIIHLMMDGYLVEKLKAGSR
jgi:sodium/bile acid cotransporter 7